MQHTFKTEKGEFLAVAIPKSDDMDMLIVGEYILFRGVKIHIPENGFGIQLLWPDCTEEKASMIVEKMTIDKFRNYKIESQYVEYLCHSAKESLASLMEREKIYCKNPMINPIRKQYSNTNEGDFLYKFSLEQYQQAQERKSENWMILKIK